MYKYKKLLLISAAAVITILLSPFLGMENLSPLDLFKMPGSTTDISVFWNIRVPRVIVSFLSGAGLSLSGMVFQAMFRNHLASPFTLGVSSGASFGAALSINLGLVFSLTIFTSTAIFAFSGALSAVLIVYSITLLKKTTSSSTLLLAGVAVNFFFSSFILFIQYISSSKSSSAIIHWLMGSVDTLGYQDIFNISIFLIPGSLLVVKYTKELNLLMAGEELAISRGVEVGKIKKHLYFAVSLMTGGIISITGPIGFVGLMVPHIGRIFVGHNHRYLIPATTLMGGVFLTLCDTLSRSAFSHAEIPVGIVTSMLGGPFFIWLLIKSRQ